MINKDEIYEGVRIRFNYELGQYEGTVSFVNGDEIEVNSDSEIWAYGLNLGNVVSITNEDVLETL